VENRRIRFPPIARAQPRKSCARAQAAGLALFHPPARVASTFLEYFAGTPPVSDRDRVRCWDCHAGTFKGGPRLPTLPMGCSAGLCRTVANVPAARRSAGAGKSLKESDNLEPGRIYLATPPRPGFAQVMAQIIRSVWRPMWPIRGPSGSRLSMELFRALLLDTRSRGFPMMVLGL